MITKPRPPKIVWLCGGFVAAACVALLVLSGMALGTYRMEDQLPFAFIGAILFPIPALLFLFLAYRALFKPSHVAALVLAVLLFFPSIPGTVAFVRGALGLLGILAVDRDFQSWSQLLIVAAFVAISVSLGSVFLRWYRILQQQRNMGS